jgi:hypothetical protein
MADRTIEQVRRFNRVVTERIGALSDRYMGRDRPLGEARVLWEIGPDGRRDIVNERPSTSARTSSPARSWSR